MERPLQLTRIADLLGEPERGLTEAEVHDRARRFGPNDIVETTTRGWWAIARDTAADPMIWFLLVTGGLYAAVGDRTEALTLLAATVPLVGMDAVLHRRLAASRAGLTALLASTATVIRDGRATIVRAPAVVPGDLALVAAGEPFPADGVVVAGDELQADESALTGEAWPVRKRPLAVVPADGGETPLPGEHWGFAGTRLLTGSARLRVAYTGAETRYGEIVRSAAAGARPRTPLQAAIASLVAALAAVATVLCIVLAAVRLGQGHGLVDALVSALTLAVAALPEEFPVVFTVFLGVGAYRLARRQALVRRAVSVENVGRVSCVCSDKTGTLTEGRLVLSHRVPARAVDPQRLVALAALAARDESHDPLDAAVRRAARADGTDAARESLAVFPFTEGRRRETAVVRRADDVIAVTKGAVEVTLAMTTLDDDERRAWLARADALAAGGHKVIACAWRPLDAATWPGGEPDRDYRFAGLLAFEDPVRPGAAAAVATCRAAGIRVVMVTGDHPATALAVARELGLGGDAPTVLTGDAVEAAIAEGDRRALARTDVVARALPGQKLALVRAFQEAGHVVAVTGDGVNDVPALQAADVGIAMGRRGVRSAREVASIVLLDDDFGTLVRAIAEGRQLFENLRASFRYLLTIHVPLVVTAAFVPLAGYPLLYLPIHIVWLELVIHPTAMLVFQDLPAETPSGPPPTGARFFTAREWLAIGTSGLLLTGVVAGGYLRGLADGDVDHARTIALATLVLASAIVTAALTRLRTATSRVVALGSLLVSALLMSTPGLAVRLHVVPLHADDWLAAALGGVVAILLPLAAFPLRRAGRRT